MHGLQSFMDLLAPLKHILPNAAIQTLRESRNTVAFHLGGLFSVKKAVFQRALHDLGIQPEDILFVQSSYDQMRSIQATPMEIIEILRETVGSTGTVVMPTFPMSGSSQEYLDEHPVFDWRRTPSRSGILTEIFRRIPGTERSIHPTHPVAAAGAAAAWITEGHDRSETPFDENSPFQKMLQRNALILCIGQFKAMTFRHLADHLIRDKIPYPIYSNSLTKVRLFGKDGKERLIFTMGHHPDIACDHQIVTERMAREGFLRRTRIGRVALFVVGVQQYIDAYHNYYTRGLFRHYLKP